MMLAKAKQAARMQMEIEKLNTNRFTTAIPPKATRFSYKFIMAFRSENLKVLRISLLPYYVYEAPLFYKGVAIWRIYLKTYKLSFQPCFFRLQLSKMTCQQLIEISEKISKRISGIFF